ncbi:MAG: T9SS type A sorting domain-containing protein [Bacteroidota bacterium]
MGAAFAKINDGTHRGVITITLTASTTEGTSAVLNASGSGSAIYTSVSIYPTTSWLTISGNLGSPVIDFNGADNVTIDGRLNQSGSTVDLTISNTSTSSGANTSTIRFINDATNNTVKYCTIKGSTTRSDAGIIYFTTGTSGNSNNIIDHNNITNAGSNRPLNTIYSNGSSTAASNKSNIISNNNIYDFFSSSGSNSWCIMLGSTPISDGYNSDWSITGNSFYETTNFTPSSGGEYRIISITSKAGSPEGDNFTISNNYIGGSGPGCTGTFVKNKGTSRYFYAMQLHLGTTHATSIQGNVIKNMKFLNDGAVDWWGIYVDMGTVNIGTTSGNYIGSASDTGSIFYSCNGAGARFLAFHLQGDATNCQNNVIGSITVANQNSANNTDFWGIHCQHRSSSNVISNNTIGSATVANSIKALSASTSSAQTVVGIYEQDNQPITLNNNTIANLTNGTTNTTAATQGKIYGIYAPAGQYSMTGNTVHDLTIANANNLSGPDGNNNSLSAGGIVMSSTWGLSQTITGNTVYNISNTYSSFTGHVVGLYYNGGGTASTVSGNFVYGLTVNSSSATISGIRITQGNSTFSNNIVTLGGNTTTNFYGIYDAGSSGTSNIYFNTVYLGGSPTSGSLNSACLYNAANSNSRNYRNNIFDNARSNNGASGKHYALYFVNTGNTLTCDYNNYYVSGTGGMLGYYGGDKSSMTIVTGQDVNSSATLPGFQNPGGISATSYIPSAILPAATGTGIGTDFAGSTRSGSPEMGAYERDATVTWTGGTSTNWNTGSNWNSGAVPTSGLNINIGTGTYQPHITQDIGSPTTCNNLTIQSGCVLTIDAGKALTVNGTLTNSAGNSGLLINSDVSGTGSLLQSSSSVGATIQRYVPGNTSLTANVYHLVSIPVSYVSPTSNLFLGSYLYKMDPTVLNSSNNYGDWINLGTSTSSPLSCNSGYMIYYPGASNTYSFSGNLNAGTFTATVAYTSNTYTYNLVPNPFPSAIDWGATSGWVRGGIGGTAYIWNGSNYTTLSQISGSIIPAGQGFIVMATGSPTLTMTYTANNLCVHNPQTFYKSAPVNVLKISAQSNKYYDETFVGFNSSAGQEFDPQFDGFKLWGLAEAPQLWTEKGESRLSVNQLPPPTGGLIVPLDFKTSYAGQVTLNVTGIESFDPSLPVRLQDHINGSVTDLRQNNNYVFNHDTSNTEKRFSLVFGYPAGIYTNLANDGKVFISNGRIYMDVPSMQGNPAKITLYDMLGQVIRSQEKTMDGIIIIEAPLAQGIYIVSVSTRGRNFVTKVVNK